MSENLRCEILSTGDEVLTGQVVDTNAAFLADAMSSAGFHVTRHTTVGDDRAALAEAFRSIGDRCDVALCTGGLGPTVDDLTTEIAAEVTGSPLKLDERAVAHMEALFASRGRVMPENNKRQAMLPVAGEVLENPIGTAPGFSIAIGRARFFFMPGVPREMEKMFKEQVLPRIAKLRSAESVFEIRLFRTFGLAESAADQMLSGALDDFPGIKLGFRAHFPEIHVKLTAIGSDSVRAHEKLDAASAEIKRRLGPVVFSEGAALEAVVGEMLMARNATVATAESCTGGLVASRITEVPGSSGYFQRGFITYSNEAKEELLGVPRAILVEHGAVSEPTVRAMAEGARARARADYAIAITGVAGPGGGTPEKPVGLVFVAVAAPTGTHVRKLKWPGTRSMIRALSAATGLDLLRRVMLGLEST